MSRKKRFFYVPTDDSGPVATYTYEDIKAKKRARRINRIKPWAFLVIVALALISAFVNVINGDISPFRTVTIVVMVVCAALGVYLAYRDKRNYTWTAIVNLVAVVIYALGTLLLIPLLFQYSDLFRHFMSSITGHETFNGGEGIVGATPWYLSLFALGFVAFLVYGLMVIVIIASLSSMLHVGDTKYIGKRPKKPKHWELVVKQQEDETEAQFNERKDAEGNDYEKAITSADRSYRRDTLLWRYRKLVAAKFMPIGLSLIAVACSALYISESYFNAIF